MTIGLLYVSLLVIGFLYSVISLLAGWFSDVGGHFHLDLGGHGDVPGHADTGHLGPISGTTVATFITGFGGGGVIAHYWLQWPLQSVDHKLHLLSGYQQAQDWRRFSHAVIDNQCS